MATPLPTLNWRMSARITLTNDNPDTLIDEIADWLNDNASTYHNASTRTPGTGSAWTAVKEDVGGTTKAARLIPPTGVDGRDQRLILAATNVVAGTPPVVPGASSWSANFLYAGHVYNVPRTDETGYVAYDDATAPYNNAGSAFTGYSPSIPTGGSTYVAFRVYESEEAIAIVIIDGSDVVRPIFGGAFIEPLSDDVDGFHPDGRLYGVTTAIQDMTDLHRGDSPFNIDTGSTYSFSYVHDPQTLGSVLALEEGRPESSGTSGQFDVGKFTTRSENFQIMIPVPIFQDGAKVMIGFLRNVYRGETGQSGSVFQRTGTDLYYRFGYSEAIVGQAYALTP